MESSDILFLIIIAHCTFFQDGTIAAAANYFGQTAVLFHFDPVTGEFGSQLPNKELLEFPGYTPKPEQLGVAGNDNTSQATSHPHQIVTHPWLPVMYLPDLGEDKLRVYSIEEEDGLTTTTVLRNLAEYQLPYGHGPRHAAISANGQYMYVLMELAAKLRPMAIDQATGELEQIQEE